jgi:hypothetical protein
MTGSSYSGSGRWKSRAATVWHFGNMLTKPGGGAGTVRGWGSVSPACRFFSTVLLAMHGSCSTSTGRPAIRSQVSHMSTPPPHNHYMGLTKAVPHPPKVLLKEPTQGPMEETEVALRVVLVWVLHHTRHTPLLGWQTLQKPSRGHRGRMSWSCRCTGDQIGGA